MAAAMPQSTFKICIEKIFDSWSVLQLAVQQAFGGYHTAEKAKWFVDVTEQWFKDNNNLDPYEVEDFFAEILNNEFDTIADDGSLSQVSWSVCKCYNLTQQGKTSEVELFLSKLHKPDLGKCEQKVVCSDEEDSEEEECCENNTETMDVTEVDQEGGAASTDTTTQENQMEADNNEENDGWTVIKKGKKKR